MKRSPYRGVRVSAVILFSFDRRQYARRVRPKYRKLGYRS
jgi:hypothetical protein